MKRKTNLFHQLKRLNGKEYLDAGAKILLSNPQICARIIKECVTELKDYDIDFIIRECIIGEPVISEIPVNRCDTVRNDSDLSTYPEKISENNSEDSDPYEGTVFFDIIFDIRIPGETEIRKIFINLEAQNKYNPGYQLVTRGIYYDARMISAQHGTEFTGEDYRQIKKVYSIWICINPDKKYRNTINRYRITEECVIGNIRKNPVDYDKMEVLVVCLQCSPEESETESESSMIRMLSVLFDKGKNAADKERILENEYDIVMNEEYNEVMNNMCNVSAYYTEDYDNAMMQLSEANEKLTETEGKLSETEGKLSETEGKLSEAKEKLSETEAENKKLAAEVAELRAQITRSHEG